MDIKAIRELREQGLTLDEAIIRSREEEINTLCKQLATREEQLGEFGGHTPACKVNFHIKGLPCDCGWDEVAKGLKVKTKGNQ